jgi:hypothetical protein
MEMSFDIKQEHHSIHIELIPFGNTWTLRVDDGLEVWHEEYSFASLGMMRVAALVRCVELNGGTFTSSPDGFQHAAVKFLMDEAQP